MKRLFCLICGCFLIGLMLPQAAWSIVLHPEGEPDSEWKAKPAAAVVGRWRTNASCVAISPNYLITTRHQGGGIGSEVYFGGTEYRVVQIWNVPAEMGTADLRVCRIETPSGLPADLPDYTPPYYAMDELDQSTVLGGFGDGRGADLLNADDIRYGYTWDTSMGNTVLRWGTNTIDQGGIVLTSLNPLAFTFYLLVDFDGLDTPNATEFEAALADHDSGSGWFVTNGDGWYVAALGFNVERPWESWYRNPNNPNNPDPNDPDYMLGVRISFYASWIEQVDPELPCSEPPPGDLDHNRRVNVQDLAILAEWWLAQNCTMANNFCAGADLIADQRVNGLDLAVLAAHWLESSECPAPDN